MALGDISKHSGTAERFINDLAQAFRKRRWVRILSLFGTAFALLLNPVSVDYGLTFLGSKNPDWYTHLIWGIVTVPFFIVAFLIALLTKSEEKIKPQLPISIIKGLLPYTSSKEDSIWFAKLQRTSILQDSLRFCAEKGLIFGVLSGESGTGKTSFLQAGLFPNLVQQEYRPIYVKITDSQPLDSIRQSLDLHSEDRIADADQSLLQVLRQATQDDARSIVLIIDQFEQFFARNKSKLSRRPFIQQMAEWHKQGDSLPVNILISIRSDFASRMNEFQSEMKYALTPHNNLSLEKFQPQEAANVISVIAKEARIELNEDFVKELTKHELANREDGAVSPLDIQILSWMIDGQKSLEERAFNRKAFQRLGGVEGLLGMFLNRALQACKTESQRRSAINVMLALTDQNVSVGVFSLKRLKEKLKGVIPDREIEEAVSWLTSSAVRLVTPIQEKNATFYELAHERLIPPLRRLALKEITDVEKAHKTLDRRLNEWIGNNRSRRYLLTFKEWRLIKRYWTLIPMDLQKEQKEEFFTFSKRRFAFRGLIFAIVLFLGIGVYAGYVWHDRKPETQAYHVKQRLVELLDKNTDSKATVYSSLLLPLLERETDRDLSERLWQRINARSGNDQYVLRCLIETYTKLSKFDGKEGDLGRISQAADKVFESELEIAKSPYNESRGLIETAEKFQAPLLSMLADAYSKLPNTQEAIIGLKKVRHSAEAFHPASEARVIASLALAYSKLPRSDKTEKDSLEMLGAAEMSLQAGVVNPDDQIEMLASLAEAYNNLPITERTPKDMERVLRAIAKTRNTTNNPDFDRFLESSLSSVGGVYCKFLDLQEALGELTKAQRILEPLDQVLLFQSFAEKLPNPEENVHVLEKILQSAENSESYYQTRLLSSLAKVYSKLPKTAETANALDRIRLAADRSLAAVGDLKSDPRGQVDMWVALAQTYSRLPDVKEAASGLERVLLSANQGLTFTNPFPQIITFGALARAYSRLTDVQEATVGLKKVREAADKPQGHPLHQVLISLAGAYSRLPNIEEATAGLEEIRVSAEADKYRADVLLSLAVAYRKLSRTQDAERMLVQAQQAAAVEQAIIKSPMLVEIAVMYGKLSEWREARATAESIGDEIHTISALSRILIVWKDAKYGTENIEALEGLFRKVSQFAPFSPETLPD